MRRLNELSRERDTMGIIRELTGAFEGIASLHIAQIKDQVLTSQKFFEDLWRIYSQIRVDQQYHFGRGRGRGKLINKELLILVTAEGSFSGDIDQQVVEAVLKVYNPANHDIVVVGRHGAVQLLQRNIKYVKGYTLPEADSNFNVLPLAQVVQQYNQTEVYYPRYFSLMKQEVQHIHMRSEVAERGKNVRENPNEIITEGDYIFEPSTRALIDHLESSMLQIMLAQVILESKLAQYASRFRAMHAARDKADDNFKGLSSSYQQAKRYIKDERAKEILNGLRKVQS